MVQVNSKDISVTSIAFLTVNHRQLSTLVDTGSSASLITISAVESLGLQDKIRKCNVYLRGISNHTLKLLGQVTAIVRVSSHLSLEQNFIVIPDEYLTSDILMGADLIGRAEFY